MKGGNGQAITQARKASYSSTGAGWRHCTDQRWKMALIVACALLAARQFNTVPDRYVDFHTYGNLRITVSKVDSLFGSTYRKYENGKETEHSKVFKDLYDPD